MTLKSIFTSFAGLASLITIANAAEPWQCDRSPLVIENVRLFGEQATTSIVIADGTIQWVGDSDALPANHDVARRIDGKGALAIPGLIDSHVHLDALPAAKHLQRELDVQTEIFPMTMRQTLASGVTTARAHLAALADMELMQLLSADRCAPAPRVILSGPGLLGGAPDVNGRLMRGIKSADDARAKIKEQAKLGASWLALHGITRFPDDELSAIIDESTQTGMKLMADTDSFENLETALRLPITSGEYINRSPADIYPDDLIDTVNAKDTDFYVVPPIGFYARSHRFAKDNMPPLSDDLFSFVPSDISAVMRERFRDAFERDEYIAAAIEAYPSYQAKLNQLREAGAKLVVGSDNGSLGQFHHDAVWHELATWNAMGVSPSETLDGATTTPANMLDMTDVGTLSPGAWGDIVLYDGDMEAGAFERNSVHSVIKGGVIFVADGTWVGPDTGQMTAEIEALQASLKD